MRPRLSHGYDVFISPHAIIKRPHLVFIGNHTVIDPFVYIATAAEIGDYVHIACHASIIGGAEGMLKMGHFSSLAAGARVICRGDEHLGHGIPGPVIPPEHRDTIIGGDTFIDGPVVFEMFANVCTNAVIMPGVTLGMGSVVGAGALVREDTEPWIIYVGVPARPLKLRPSAVMIEAAKAMGYDC